MTHAQRMSIAAALVAVGCGGARRDNCQPGDAGATGFALCGTIDGESLAYVPSYLQWFARGVVPLGLEAMGPDGAWLRLRGPGAWTDDNPHSLSSWFFRPQSGWANDGVWLCGQAGALTGFDEYSFDGALNEPSILPACGRQGGAESLHVEGEGSFTPFDGGGGCEIRFRTSDARVTLLAFACPEEGVPLPLDGLRLFERFEATDATACIGSGASVTWIPDAAASSPTKHLIVDIPSLSASETCSPTVSGE